MSIVIAGVLLAAGWFAFEIVVVFVAGILVGMDEMPR